MWIWNVLTSEFFWGVIVGIFLTVVGSFFLAWFTAIRQRQERKEILKAFCADTITNIRQIVDDMDNTRSKGKIIHGDYLTLMDVETNVFGRNREHLVILPAQLRDRIRRFVTDCAIRRAEIGNQLTLFNNQWALADQFQAQGNGVHAQSLRSAATSGPLAAAHKALDALVVRASESVGLVRDINTSK